jgi:hypothetical protein
MSLSRFRGLKEAPLPGIKGVIPIGVRSLFPLRLFYVHVCSMMTHDGVSTFVSGTGPDGVSRTGRWFGAHVESAVPPKERTWH